MTEEIIKECKNCDALGIDSEIGVYYCCLSHRQDDLPKEFTCNDFTPNKQLQRLEQENKKLRKANEISIEKITVTAEAKRLQELEQENKELKEKKDKYYQQTLDDEILMNELSLEVDLRKKESDFYLEKLSKYRSALEEIREIAEKYKNMEGCRIPLGAIEMNINEVLQ